MRQRIVIGYRHRVGLAHAAAATSESAAAIIATISATGTPCAHVTQTGADTPADRPSCTLNCDPVRIFAPSGGAPGASVSMYISACDYATARGHMRIAIVEDARPTWFIAMPTAAAAATLAADLHARSAGPVSYGETVWSAALMGPALHTVSRTDPARWLRPIPRQ